jgi:hypothetical protein
MGAPRLKRSSKRAWPPATALYTAIAAAALACGVWYAFPRSLAPSEDASNAGWRTDAEVSCVRYALSVLIASRS